MKTLFILKQWIYQKLISRAKFRKWLELEDIRSQIKKAAEDGNHEDVSLRICDYLSAALYRERWEKVSWDHVLESFAFAIDRHSPKDNYKIFSNKSATELFQVNDSSWYSWSHMLAREYGWSLEYIANLDIDEAISLVQEVLYDEQLRREWEWALSDKSVQYNKDRKESKFVPLERPDWMKAPAEIKEPETTQIRSDMMPMGVVMTWEELASVKH